MSTQVGAELPQGRSAQEFLDQKRKKFAEQRTEHADDEEACFKEMAELCQGAGIQPCKYPNKKAFISLIGTTSSGKSSLANYFMGFPIQHISVC